MFSSLGKYKEWDCDHTGDADFFRCSNNDDDGSDDELQ